MSISPARAAACIRRLLLSWLIAALVQALASGGRQSLSGLAGLEAMSAPGLAAVTVAVFVLLSCLARRFSTARWERWAIAAVFALLSMIFPFTWPFFLACLVVEAVLVVYAWKGADLQPDRWQAPEGKSRLAVAAAAAMGIAFFLFVTAWTVCRVLSYAVPSFDFGIFSQMFHHMRTTGLPNTTLERDGLLSHFAVHVSPIYYLLLPAYCLFPYPETLQVLQALVLASGAIPLWKLCRGRGFSPWAAAAGVALLLLYPAYAGGTSYDIHENAFLTPLLLWLFVGIESRKGWLTGLAAAMTLLVKEDAAVYVAVVGLWVLARAALRSPRRWDAAAGGALLAGSVAWFLLVTSYLAGQGDGVMTYRYENFLFGGSSSLVTVIVAALLSPMKVLYECVDPENLQFLGLTMGPLLALPLVTRKYDRLILLIPYILVNLMSDYPYQHDIFFQYTFGSTACLAYLTVVNLADLAPVLGKWLQAACLAVAAVCFVVTVLPTGVNYVNRYLDNRGYYTQLTQTLAQVPQDAPVTATTFYTTALSQRAVLYDLRYSSQAHLLSTQYVVINPEDRNSYRNYGGYAGFRALLEEAGYVCTEQLGQTLEIWVKAI